MSQSTIARHMDVYLLRNLTGGVRRHYTRYVYLRSIKEGMVSRGFDNTSQPINSLKNLTTRP